MENQKKTPKKPKGLTSKQLEKLMAKHLKKVEKQIKKQVKKEIEVFKDWMIDKNKMVKNDVKPKEMSDKPITTVKKEIKTTPNKKQ